MNKVVDLGFRNLPLIITMPILRSVSVEVGRVVESSGTGTGNHKCRYTVRDGLYSGKRSDSFNK